MSPSIPVVHDDAATGIAFVLKSLRIENRLARVQQLRAGEAAERPPPSEPSEGANHADLVGRGPAVQAGTGE